MARLGCGVLLPATSLLSPPCKRVNVLALRLGRGWWAGGQAGVLRFSNPLMMCKWYCCELPRILLCLGLRSWHLLAAACDETSCWRLKSLSVWQRGAVEGSGGGENCSVH